MPAHPPLLVRGAAVLDGSGRDAVVADVRVRDGLVSEVRPGLSVEPGEEAVDAGGLVLAQREQVRVRTGDLHLRAVELEVRHERLGSVVRLGGSILPRLQQLVN